MLDKLVREVVKGAAEVVVSPLTLTKEIVEKTDKVVRDATEPKEK